VLAVDLGGRSFVAGGNSAAQRRQHDLQLTNSTVRHLVTILTCQLP